MKQQAESGKAGEAHTAAEEAALKGIVGKYNISKGDMDGTPAWRALRERFGRRKTCCVCPLLLAFSHAALQPCSSGVTRTTSSSL